MTKQTRVANPPMAKHATERAERAPEAPALQLQALTKRFGATEVLRGVDLTIARGERHAIIGPNGAGKSTLFNLISGRAAPSSGQVYLHGRNITGRRPYEINRLGLARSFQITNIFPRMSVFDNVRCAALWSLGHRYAFWRSLERLADATQRAEETLRRIGLQRRRIDVAGLLSYAEQRALEIGITIAGGASVILLDEPTAGMSRSETRNAVALIREVTQGCTLVIVEHDMSVVFDLADRVSVLVYGAVLASDVPASIRANRQVQQAYLGTTVAAGAA
jgi:branched-chain amino acid transport system ATP-binding protein